jgi:hypothetical protein
VMYSPDGKESIDYSSRYLTDSSEFFSADWENRILYGADGTTPALSWGIPGSLQTPYNIQIGDASTGQGIVSLYDGANNQYLNITAGDNEIDFDSSSLGGLNLSTTGGIYASSFTGDGSGLTNLPAPTLAKSKIGYGDASNLLTSRTDFNIDASGNVTIPASLKIANQSYRMGFVPAGGFATEFCINTPNCGGQDLAAEGLDFYLDTRSSFGLFTIYHNQKGTGTQRFPFSMSNQETINIGTHTQNNTSAELYVKPSVLVSAQTKPVAQFDANSTWTGDLTQWLKNGAVQAKVTIDGNGLFKNINSTADLNAQNLLIRNDANIVRDLNVYRNLTNFATTTLKDLNISGNIKVGGTPTIVDGNKWVINSVDLLGLTYTRCYTTYQKGLVIDSNCAVS